MTDSDAPLATLPDSGGNVRICIRPNRSLPLQDMLPLFIAISAVLVTIGVGFALLGAWPVLPFAGLEIAIVGAVIRWMYRHHGDHELVIITDDRVRVYRRDGRTERKAEFNRYWAKVSVTPSAGSGHAPKVEIGSHGRYVEIGADVHEEDRRRLAQEIRSAIARKRQLSV